MWTSWDSVTRAFWLRDRLGTCVTLNGVEVLLLTIRRTYGGWWVSGYERGDLAEPVRLRVDQVRPAQGAVTRVAARLG
jgi:hypothetical protein